MLLRSLALFATLLAFNIGVSSQAQGADLAFRRAEHLRHGINTGMWFAQAPGNYSVERLRTFITEDDLALIHELGFDHIRLSIDPVPFEEWQRGDARGAAFVGELDRVVKAANADGLAVIVDVHPEDSFKQALLSGTEQVNRFALLWQAIARHYTTGAAAADPDLVYFEIMNEPEQTDTYRWQGIEAFVAQQIRAVAPQSTIIAAAANYDGLPDLLRFEPLVVTNVIYSFHDYDPFTFTHQAATWAGTEQMPLTHVPYPSTPDNVADNVAQEPTLAGAFYVEQYGLDRWDATRITRTIAFAARWAKMHNVPVYCGEFGVHRIAVNAADRERWLHDMRVALNGDNIGWAMWEYQTSFGVVTKTNGQTVVDKGVVAALGLRQP